MERIFITLLLLPLLLSLIANFYSPKRSVGLANDHSGISDEAYVEFEKTRDSLGFEAITQLHKQMDDDQSGSVTLEESIGFVREELAINEKERIGRRQKAFHVNDDQFITVEDLWHKWVLCEERKWTVEETLEWLRDAVELPQYVETFQRNLIDGKAVARLSIQNASFLINILGIQNSVHRQKLQVKAMDVVLFGYRKHPASFWKDVLLTLTVVGSISLIVFYRYQRYKSDKEMNHLSSQMEQLKNLESEYHTMQQEFERSKGTDEIDALRKSLEDAERRLERERESGVFGCGAPLALQPLLRKTCEMEMSRMAQQRIEGIKEMREAMDMVEKLRRKQSSVVSSFKLAIASSGAEELETRIVGIKGKMEKLGKQQEECHQRWLQIESLCGFSVIGVGGPGGVNPKRPGRLSALARPASLNGLTHLPFALTSALAAVPNAYAGISRPAPSLATVPIEEQEESNSSAVNINVAAYSPASLYAPAVGRSASYSTSNAYNHTLALNARSPTSESLQRLESTQSTSSSERPFFQVGDPASSPEAWSVSTGSSIRERNPHLRQTVKTESQESSGSSNASEETSKTGSSKSKKTFSLFKKKR